MTVPSSREKPSSKQRLWRLLALALVLAFILTTVILVWTLSWNRAFQVDEVEHLHAAYNVRAGLLIYADFFQAHNPLLYYVLGPAIDVDDPVGSYHRSRLLITILLTLNVLLCGFCAWRFAGLSGASLAVGLAFTHSTLVDRGIEVRTDSPMSLCLMAALAVELGFSSWQRLRPQLLWRYTLEAFFLSIAFLYTNKAAFACFAFGSLWLAEAFRRRRWSLVVLPMVVWIVPLAITASLMAAAGNLEEFAAINLSDAVGEITQSMDHTRGFDVGLAGKFLLQEARRNPLFCILALAGWLYAMLTWWRSGDAAKLGFPAYLALVLFVSIWLNPFPFPYLHVTVLPVFVVLAAVAAVRFGERLGWRSGEAASLGLVFVLLAGTGIRSVPYLIERAAYDAELQFDILREIQRITEPDEAVLDLVGLYFRPDATPIYIMIANTVTRYAQGTFERIPDTLRQRRGVAYIFNYRTPWLPAEDKTFLRRHFVAYDRNIFLLGSPLDMAPGESLAFEVLRSKIFRYDGEGSILVDGEPFRQGLLERGPHQVERLTRRGPDRLIMATPEPRPWPPRPPVLLYDFFQ